MYSVVKFFLKDMIMMIVLWKTCITFILLLLIIFIHSKVLITLLVTDLFSTALLLSTAINTCIHIF